ncbi:hypothetical protein NC653_024128 [Populus alba x Populus x berolinensis]|uniref:Beta-amylase n=1 Tax=Populus alba x Populus x berolinensis TaxID=444605 RepID=A0AAD6M916_9ROSI|nr:hypothetical protein NC653_024128 [Populus alba x Populus x berolinensis]
MQVSTNNWPEETPSFSEKKVVAGPVPTVNSSSLGTTQMLLDPRLQEFIGTMETRSHAPELTAGYYNTRFRDGYLPIARMLARHGAIFNFTCIEMRDHEQPQDALCAPEKLVRQVALATREAGIPLAGENALPRYDEYAHEQILQASSLNIDESSDDKEMCAFTYLRMNPHLFQPDNWRRFVAFVKKMKEGKSADRCWEEVEREAEHFVHVEQWTETIQDTANAACRDSTSAGAPSTGDSAQLGEGSECWFPAAGKREVDAADCKTVYLSESFVREIYDGQLFIKLKKGFDLPANGSMGNK